MSGVCFAAMATRRGLNSVTVFEKASQLGGTWRDNTYPGLYCDVPSRIYQYSFAKNPGWLQTFSRGSDILQYLIGVADDHGLSPNFRYDTEIVAAALNDDGTWTVTTSAGSNEVFDFVVCATGFLHHPYMPQIEGLEAFEGVVFHTARWDHSVNFATQQVGIIGTGSTGVQVATALSGKVKHLTVFQRTPQWILPIPNPTISGANRAIRRRFPLVDTLSYLGQRKLFEFALGGLVKGGLRRSAVQAMCRHHLLMLRDPHLRRAMTPDYEPMCKRLISSPSFYRKIQRSDVSVVSSAIDRVVSRGIVTLDGTLHKLDVIILATGFDAHAYMRPMKVIGRNHMTLEQIWKEGPRGFQTVMLPYFPNLFMLIGPHSPIGNYPLTVVAECQSEHILDWIRRWGRGEFTAVEPTAEATERFNNDLSKAMPNTVWSSGCNSWYLNSDGTPDLWPWSPRAHRDLLRRRPQMDDYRFAR
jgi:cation diffusion facilitator CzcD-associated flavoprotein CzcO